VRVMLYGDAPCHLHPLPLTMEPVCPHPTPPSPAKTHGQNAPTVEAMRAAVKVAKDGANRWLDNVYALRVRRARAQGGGGGGAG